MKVLIVESDWRFAHQAVKYLESRAHHAVLLPDASDAVAATRRWKPDLVILAAELSDGVIEQLNALEEKPAVLLTGWMDHYKTVWRAWQKGGDELLMKPFFDIRELHSAVVSARENAVARTSAPATSKRVSA